LQILLSLASVYAGFGLIFILNGYLAEHLDLEGFGDIQVAFSVSAFLGTILVLGGGAGAGKFLPVYMQARRFAEAKGYLQTHFKQTIILSLGLLVISGSLGLTFHLLGMERLEHVAVLSVILAPLFAVALLSTLVVGALQRPFAAIFPSEVLRPALFLLGAMAWLAVFPTFTDREVIAIFFAALCLVCAVQLYFLRGGLAFDWAATEATFDKETWREVTRSLLFVVLANLFLISLMIIAMEVLHTDEADVGIFAILFFVTSFVWTNFNAVMNVAAPKISELTGDREGLQKLFNQAFGVTFLMSVLTAAPLAFLAEGILTYFHYDAAAYADWLLIALAIAPVNCALLTAVPFLTLGGHHRQAVKVSIVLLATTLVVAPGAVFLYGLEGAILALLALRFLRGVSFVWLLRQRAGVKILGIV